MPALLMRRLFSTYTDLDSPLDALGDRQGHHLVIRRVRPALSPVGHISAAPAPRISSNP
jgi:hypothetical protein